jgi:hypothetical protein
MQRTANARFASLPWQERGHQNCLKKGVTPFDTKGNKWMVAKVRDLSELIKRP